MGRRSLSPVTVSDANGAALRALTCPYLVHILRAMNRLRILVCLVLVLAGCGVKKFETCQACAGAGFLLDTSRAGFVLVLSPAAPEYFRLDEEGRAQLRSAKGEALHWHDKRAFLCRYCDGTGNANR